MDILSEIKRGIAIANTAQRLEWAKIFVAQNVPIKKIYPLLYEIDPIPMRTSWFLSDICAIDLKFASIILTDLFPIRSTIKIKNFERSLAKWSYLGGIPKQMEEEVIHALFTWLEDPKSGRYTKHCCIKSLDNVVVSYPELKNELDELVKIYHATKSERHKRI